MSEDPVRGAQFTVVECSTVHGDYKSLKYIFIAWFVR